MATAKKEANGKNDILGTGRRKKAVARVRVRAGSGTITVNDRPFEEYFPSEQDRRNVLSPLQKTDRVKAVDVVCTVNGGGLTGQAGAVMLGVARALKLFDPALEPALREGSLLTRDGRMKERKKYGHKGARKSFQFSKR
jgi:small subunit ribosomal protein S9